MRARRLDLAPPDVEIVLVEIFSTLRRRRLMVVDGDGHSLQRTERSFRWAMTHVKSRSSTIAPAPIAIPNRTHGHTALLRIVDVGPLATLGTTDGLFAKSAGSPRSCRGESRRVRLLNPVPGMPRLTYVPRVPTLTLAPRYELVDGELLVTPSPSGRHQRLLLHLTFRRREYLSRKDWRGQARPRRAAARDTPAFRAGPVCRSGLRGTPTGGNRCVDPSLADL